MSAHTFFDEWIAQRYDRLWPELFSPAVINPAVDFLASLGGPALELGVGTGRIAVPLSQRGVAVSGIELSEAMVTQLRSQADAVSVTIGDFARTTVDHRFWLVYLVRNTITNLTTQDEQVSCFLNAAAHLSPGGVFVIENYIPSPVHEGVRVFARTPTHLGFEEYDSAAQIAVSHHYWVIDGELKTFSSPHRYLWPGELDLMARIAGLILVERWGSWDRTPFTSQSDSHISVWQKPT